METKKLIEEIKEQILLIEEDIDKTNLKLEQIN